MIMNDPFPPPFNDLVDQTRSPLRPESYKKCVGDALPLLCSVMEIKFRGSVVPWWSLLGADYDAKQHYVTTTTRKLRHILIIFRARNLYTELI